MRTFIRFNITHVHLRLSSTQRFTDIDVNNGDPGDQKKKPCFERCRGFDSWWHGDSRDKAWIRTYALCRLMSPRDFQMCQSFYASSAWVSREEFVFVLIRSQANLANPEFLRQPGACSVWHSLFALGLGCVRWLFRRACHLEPPLAV